MRLDAPTEDKAVRVVDQANNRMCAIIEKYNGRFQFGDINRDQSIVMDAHGFGENGFLSRLEREYQNCTLEDIKITEMSRKEFDVKEAVARVESQKKPIELAEVGENIGVSAKPDGSRSSAAQFAREYSARMNQKTEPED